MSYRNITENDLVEYVKKVLDYYSRIDNHSVNRILTREDEDARRNNVGWYRREDGEHRININVPNMMGAIEFIKRGILDTDAFYAFMVLVTGHEFRHFMQGRCIYEGLEVDGYGQRDVLAAELMLFIRYFFDAYYLNNKGSVKYELDAERFAIVNGVSVLKELNSNMDATAAMVGAVTFYGNLQLNNGVAPTLPIGCKTIPEMVDSLTRSIDENHRNPNLVETLQIYNPNYFRNHLEYGLNHNKLLTPNLALRYREEQDGYRRDLLVAKSILESLSHPIEALEDFPTLKKYYVNKAI